MQWRKEYDEKRLLPGDAVGLLKDSTNLILGMSVLCPSLTKALGEAFAKISCLHSISITCTAPKLWQTPC